MKASSTSVAVFSLLFAALNIRAQQQPLERATSTSDRLTAPINQERVKEALKDIEATKTSAEATANLGKHVRLGGPLVKVFKGG